MFNYQLEQLLAKAQTTTEAEALLLNYMQQFHFKHLAFTYYSGHTKSGRKLRYNFVSKALKPWHEHYLSQHYSDVDRTLEEGHHITLPLFWDVQNQLLHAKNKREKRVRLESIEFGIYKGLLLPVHGPEQDFATLTLHQFQNETCLDSYETKQFEWLSAAQIYYHHIKRILDSEQKPENIFNLTRREEQCLVLTSNMWRVSQIAKSLKISPRTVNFHIQNANKKIGSNNKYLTAHKYLEWINNH